MPRTARIKSPTKLYHVTARGSNKQILFNEQADFKVFMEILKKNMIECGFELYAYCLMDNHYHLVIRDNKDQIDVIFKKINTAYAYYFNTKYERTGHLFQDRFFSEPLVTANQLVNTIRYIHRNPVKAGICSDISDYRYSSYNDYLRSDGGSIRQGVLEELFGDAASFIEFNSISEDPEPADTERSVRRGLTDQDAIEIIKRIFSNYGISGLDTVTKRVRDEIISELKKRCLSIKQIARLTGVPLGIAARAGRK